MAITLPTPLRVAAGIVASGIALVRSLPEEIPALPVTLVGKAMQLSMKVQQEIADLATKGDELLSGVLGGPQENPPWAQFDDEPPPATPVAAGSRPKEPTRPAMPGAAGSARAGAARAGTAAAGATARVAEGGKAPVVTPLARSTNPGGDGAAGKAEETTDAKAKQGKGKKSKDSKPKQDKAKPDQHKAEPDQHKAPGLVHPSADTVAAAADSPSEPPVLEATEPETTEPEATEPEATEPEATEPEATEPTAADKGDTDGTPVDTDAVSANGEAPTSAAEETDKPDETDETAEADDGPFALPDYDRMTLAQVRGYLRSLSAQEVQSLLDHEQSGENRAPFLTLLSNRLVTLEHQES